MSEVEELNRDFTRSCEQHKGQETRTQRLPRPSSGADITPDKRYEEWTKLIQEIPDILDHMGSAFGTWRRSGIIDVEGTESPAAAIRRGNILIHTQLLYIADVFKNSGLLDKWDELVKGTEAGDFQRATTELGYSAISRYMKKKQEFIDALVRVAREDLKTI